MWTVQFSPPKPGEWATDSDTDDDGLNDVGTFTVASYRGSNPIREHGHLQISGNERTIENADGTPFLWLGDTVWSASAKATLEERTEYLTKRQSQGTTSSS